MRPATSAQSAAGNRTPRRGSEQFSTQQVTGLIVHSMATMAATLSPARDAASAEAALRLDFRSDTITQPTPAMREAMRDAQVGDDVFGEDPSINALEAEAAQIFGKEAGLFVASGTQGNLLALLSQTHPGDEFIAEASAHIANAEVGGAARLGGLTAATSRRQRTARSHPSRWPARCGPKTSTSRARRCWPSRTRTTTRAARSLSSDEMDRLAEAAREHGLKVHVDGARIFNAAVALGRRRRPPGAHRRHADVLPVQRPVGAGRLGAGSARQAVIAEARRYRKMIGGGMRQAGVLAAAGLIALRDGVSTGWRTIIGARDGWPKGWRECLASSIDLATVQTNIVRFDVGGHGPDRGVVRGRSCCATASGFRAVPGTGVRMVAHRHIDDERRSTLALDGDGSASPRTSGQLLSQRAGPGARPRRGARRWSGCSGWRGEWRQRTSTKSAICWSRSDASAPRTWRWPRRARSPVDARGDRRWRRTRSWSLDGDVLGKPADAGAARDDAASACAGERTDVLTGVVLRTRDGQAVGRRGLARGW